MTQLFQSTYDGYVNLITVDLTGYGDGIFGFVDSRPFLDPNPGLDILEWQNQAFKPVPFTTSGYQRGGDQLVKPKISLPDFGAGLWVILNQYNLAPGAPVIRYQALAADILTNNQYAPFSEERYLLNTVTFDGQVLEAELATHIDYQRSQFPSHEMYRDEFPGLGSQLASN